MAELDPSHNSNIPFLFPHFQKYIQDFLGFARLSCPNFEAALYSEAMGQYSCSSALFDKRLKN
jgi:hypothetical protein